MQIHGAHAYPALKYISLFEKDNAAGLRLCGFNFVRWSGGMRLPSATKVSAEDYQ